MAPSEPSPVSDESSSEGPYLQVVNDTIAHDQPTVMSPRSALLAHTSLREHSAEPITTIVESSRTRKRNSASERRRKRERDLANASPSQRELVRLLIDQEQEAYTLRKQLHIANQRVDFEARRAAELEQANQQVTQRYREINESKVVVQQEATKAIQDSRVSHLELENAQKEIERARESLKRIEKERDEAEAATARARAKARKLREQQIVAAAREEGRRLGFEAGFEHARQERLSIAATPRGAALRRNSRLRNRDLATRPLSPADNASGREPPSSNKDVVNSPAESASGQNPLSSSRDVTRPYFPPAPYRGSIRRSNPQEEDEAALRSSRLLDDLDASPEMSVFDLPIRNLPPIDPAVNSPAVSAGLPPTPLRPFRPPPESTFGSRPPTPTPPASSSPTIQAQEAPSQLADRSPPIQFFSIDIPPQEELSRAEFEREFNTKENPNDIIKRIPPEGWVTAAKHREIRGSPPAPYPGPQPPPLLPAPYPQPQPKNARLAKPVPKAVRFPSLAKTKQQAVSWYRSLSLRRKNRPVIDPVDDAGASAQNRSTTPTSATSNKGKAPEPNSASTESSDDSQYGVPPRPSQSWYKKSAPSSIYNTDGKRRPISGAESSPGLSQFELLFTPHVGTSSVKSGKEGKKLKEKDSQLSVIKEETPTNDRFFPNAMVASSSKMASSSTVPRPNFIRLEQKGSRGTLGSSSSPIKRQHPLAIVVPDPEEPLPPAGVAYSQPGPSNSQSSGKTSIAIEVVPPSGFAPDPVHSPTHTGRNHLSPYHVFRPTSQPSSSRIIPMASITSLQGSSDKDLGPPPPLPIGSRSGSRASSRRADNEGLEPSRPRSAASRPQSAMSATPYNNPMGNKSAEDARSSHSRTPRAPTTPTMMPRETQSSPRPKSAQSAASKNQLSVLNLNASQTNLAGRQQSSQHPSSSTLNLVPPFHHSTSRVSLREAGSFSNGFDDGTYLDPAYFPGDKPAVGSHLDPRPVSRGTSSALSYV